jgi:hydrogenase nickel incorporation protein HypB
MPEIKLIEIREEILADNKVLAEEIRDLLHKKRTFMLNIMSSPGSDKTSLILQTIRKMKGAFKIGVIEGDIDSTVDAEKVLREGVTAIQLKTGGFCHLDASMLQKALKELDLSNLDLIIIENVGNLVCPAEFDTGSIKNAMILSIPEGDDKPLKYPLMFTVCDVLIVNKTDYLEGSDFDMQALENRVLKLNPAIKIFKLSCKTGVGVNTWTDWLEGEVAISNYT